jgi:hypothetical protein
MIVLKNYVKIEYKLSRTWRKNFSLHEKSIIMLSQQECSLHNVA